MASLLQGRIQRIQAGRDGLRVYHVLVAPPVWLELAWSAPILAEPYPIGTRRTGQVVAQKARSLSGAETATAMTALPPLWQLPQHIVCRVTAWKPMRFEADLADLFVRAGMSEYDAYTLQTLEPLENWGFVAAREQMALREQDQVELTLALVGVSA